MPSGDQFTNPGSATLAATETDGNVIPSDLVERLPPIYHADCDRHLVFCNKEFNDIAQATFSEFRSQERREQRTPLAPFELREIFDRLNAGENVIKLRQTVEINYATRHFRSTHFRIEEGGELIGFGGIYTDVTLEAEAIMQSAKSEARFQDVVRSASD